MAIRELFMIFQFIALLTRLRSFFFDPWSPSSLFLRNPERCAPENDRHSSYQKIIWGHGVPFGNKSDPIFCIKKPEYELEVSSFGGAWTVVGLKV